MDNILLKNLKILYVEDDPEVSQQMSFFLKKRVGKLIVAENGEEGLRLFKEYLPDLILSDLRMPVMDGISMSREIRQISDVPIIISTAFSDKEIILRAVDLGIENYVLKPIDIQELMEAMEKAAIKIHRKKGTLLMIRNRAYTSEEKIKLEDQIKNAIAKFIKENTGKGPQNIKVFIYGDKIEMEIVDVFTKMEKLLLRNPKNVSMVKYAREVFYKDSEKELSDILKDFIEAELKLGTIEIDTENDKNYIKLLF